MPDLIICRCEEVSLKKLEDSAKQFNCSARELKLRTRVGMGICGGRTCRPAVDEIIASLLNEEPSHYIPLKVQPPIRPLSLSHLGGNYNDTN